MHSDHDGHSHDHTHTHEHTHEHGEIGQKDLALLKYMLDHNRQHARELVQSAEMLKSAGRADAAELIFDAVHYFEHGNDKLEGAVNALSGN